MKCTLYGVLFAITLITNAAAEALSYSGRLVNTNGSPVVGTPTLRFELASSADDTTILCFDQLTGVPLTHGVFHVKINFNCGGQSLAQRLTTIEAAGDEAIFRVINVTASKTYSFQELNAVPRSSLSSMALQLSQNGATPGQVLAWDGTKWSPLTPGAGIGTVTSITAGTGLSGGTINSSGTIAIASGGVTDTHLASGIDRSKLAAGTPNTIVVNDGSGNLSNVAQLPITQGGTGANTAAAARTNLGLGSAAELNLGTSWGGVLNAALPTCQSWERLTVTSLPTVTLICDVDNSTDNTKLPLAGGAMAGAINMGGNAITNLSGPSALTDAATKGYVDTQLGSVSSSQWTTSGSNIYYNTGNVGIGASSPVSKLHITGKLTVKPDFGTPNTGTTDAVATFDREVGSVGINLFTSNGNTASVYFGDTSTINSGAIKYLVHSGIPSTQQMDFFVNNASRMTITGTGSVDVLNVLRLKSDNTNFVSFRAPASLASNLTLNFPGTNGSTGQALITDGSGNLSWATVATGASSVGGDLSGTMSSAVINASAVTSSKIADGTIVDADIAAGAAIAQSKISGLSTTLSTKEDSIGLGTTAQYWRGDKSWQTLNTAAVPESTNQYFTEARVLGTDLAGLSSTPGVISAADTVLTAIGKLAGNQSGYVAKTGDSMTGALAMGNNRITGLGAPSAGTDAATKTYVDSKATQWITTGSDIYYNTGNVGVGTNAPGTTFHVNSAANTVLRVSAPNSTRDAQIEFMRGASGSWLGPSAGGTWDIWTVENIPMIFAVNDDEKMRIDANGNVGIGTDTPGAELHVVDTTDSQAFVRIDSARTANGASTAVVEMNATASPAPANKKNFQIMNVNGTTGNQLTVMATNDDKTQKAKRLTITHDGDVAIGTTTTPGAKLEVEGGVKIGNDAGTCDASKQGTMRFVGGNFQGCDGTSWVTMGSSTPAGEVATYAMSTCPSGWIKANGAAVSRATYAGLFAAIGTSWGAGDGSTTFNVPDLRGEFVRGWDDGRGVDTGRAIASAQADDNKSHTHTGTTSSNGDHAHTGTTSTDGWHGHTGTTDVAGWHGHAVNAAFAHDGSVNITNDWSTDAILGSDNANGANTWRSTAQGTEGNGNHAHNLSIAGNGSHAHTMTTSTTGAHTHTMTTAASGGTETRPRNKALLYCIKY